MSDEWPIKAICFLIIFFIIGKIFSIWFSYVLSWPYNDISGFSIGLVAAAAFSGVALKKFW